MKAMTEAECKQYMLDHKLSSHIIKDQNDETEGWLIIGENDRSEEAPDWVQAVNQYRTVHGDQTDDE